MSDTRMSSDKQQAMSLLQQGEADQSRILLEAYCAQHPQDAQAWFNLGMANVQLNRGEAAESCFRKAVVLEPAKAVIHYNLGKTLQMMGRLSDAEACYREAARLNPGLEAAYANLGTVLLDQGRPEEAAASFNQALLIAPRLAEAYYNLGNALRRLSRFEEAEKSYRRALELKSGLVEAHESLGTLMVTMGRFNEAVDSYHSALELRPDLLLARCGLAAALKELGLGFRAEACYREILEIDPNFVQAYIGLGRLFLDSGLYQAARENYQRVLELDPDHPSAAAEFAIVLEHMGSVQEGWETLRPVLQWEGRDKVVTALAFADISRHVGRQEDALDMIESVLSEAKEASLTPRQQQLLHFAAGRLLDRFGLYDRAFEHYSRGNQFYSETFDCNELANTVSRHMTVFSAEFLRRAPKAKNGSERPVFIVGMPRSGTSLVEQILASHPDVYGAGELDDINWMAISLSNTLGSTSPYPECVTDLTEEKCEMLADKYLERLSVLAPDTAKRVTDKMPGNYLHLGLIALLFPAARIIHCIRDPMDTCLSCYFQSFIRANNHQYSYDLKHLGCAYRQYERMMAHWESVLDLPIMNVSYESLVTNQEQATRDLLAFCGLSWNDKCLRFYEAKRMVVTASYDQVRRPLYKSSIGRWKHYERHLEPLRKALAGDA
jgi:tetratricopeptide (TPR) repeat protein